jgi:hypothetical protein
MAKKPTSPKKAKVNKALDGLNVNVNSLGEVETSYDIDKLNQFLNEHVDDKKLKDRELPSKSNNKQKP